MNTTRSYSIKRAYYRGACCPACGATGGIDDTNGEWSTAKCAYVCTCGHEWAAADYANGGDITLAVEVAL